MDDQLIEELVDRAQVEGLQTAGDGQLQQLTNRLLESAPEFDIPLRRGHRATNNGLNGAGSKRSAAVAAGRPAAPMRAYVRPCHLRLTGLAKSSGLWRLLSGGGLVEGLAPNGQGGQVRVPYESLHQNARPPVVHIPDRRDDLHDRRALFC
ncbi:hypothetical protein ACFYXC_38105 [Streptomyces sp. NPDC002701]|uniref:hypothetical protein n=1 Tax=Streptomyces sp. NPDC002701 TaxID=3364661 RepID=UPI0036AE67F8